MNLKQCQNIFHVTANINSIVQHAIQIKGGITKHLNVNVKIIIHVKETVAGAIVYAFVRVISI